MMATCAPLGGRSKAGSWAVAKELRQSNRARVSAVFMAVCMYMRLDAKWLAFHGNRRGGPANSMYRLHWRARAPAPHAPTSNRDALREVHVERVKVLGAHVAKKHEGVIGGVVVPGPEVASVVLLKS